PRHGRGPPSRRPDAGRGTRPPDPGRGGQRGPHRGGLRGHAEPAGALGRPRARLGERPGHDGPRAGGVTDVLDTTQEPAGAAGQPSREATFRLHEGGKLRVESRVPLVDRDSLAMAYTPGVADVSAAIRDDRELSFQYTGRAN